MGPIDYSGGFATENPQDAMLAGLKNGIALGGIQDKRAEAERAALQQQQMQADMSALSANPSAAEIARYSIKYPQLSEQFKRSYEMIEPVERQAKLEHATQVFAAFNADKPDIALKLMRDQAVALRNSGKDREAGATEAMASAFEMDPVFAKINTGKMLAAMAGPDKFAAAYASIGGEERAQDLQGSTVAKAEADAMTAGITADVAQNTAGTKVEQAKEDVLTAQAKREIDRMNAAIGQADSETKRGQLILERDKYIADQGLKATERGEGAQNQIEKVKVSMDTVNSILKHPGLEGWFGTGTLSGKLAALLPGTDSKDVRAMVDTLKSQQFLTAIPQIQGLGALSNAEGAKLETAIASLDTDQSQPQFKANLGVIRSLLVKAEAKLLASPKLPTAGGGFVINHPKFGAVREGDINRLMKSQPGATREQVIEYLKSTGAK